MNEGLSTKDAKKLNKASVLSHSNNPEDQDRARARQVEVDYKDLMKQIKARKRIRKESFVLEREDSPYEKASDKALDKKYGYGTSHDKGPKTGFGRASNRNTAAAVLKDIRRRKSKSTAETRADAAHKGWSATARTSKDQTPEKKATRKKLADTPYKKLPKDEQEKDQVAADAVKKEYDKRKYQKEDWKPEIEVIDTKKRKKDAEKKRKEAESSLPPHLRLDVMKKAFAHTNESLGFTIDSGEHKKASKKAKLRNLARGNENPAEKAAAEKKAGGPKLYGEGASIIQGGRSSKKVGYRGPTSGKSQPKKSASFRGEKDESLPSKHKSARYASQLHRLRPRSERVNEEPERTAEYKSMQASLYPRGDAEGATAHRVGGWKKKRPRNVTTKRNRGYRKPAGARVEEELTFEGWKDRAASAIKKVVKKKEKPHKYPEGGGPYVDAGAEAADRVKKKEQRKVGILPDQRGTARKDDR